MDFTVNDVGNINGVTQFKDTRVDGEIDSNGAVIEVVNNEAYSNAFRIWIASRKGDTLRSIRGGYGTAFIGKPINNAQAAIIKSSLTLALTSDFSTTFTLVELTVIPDYDRKKWIIRVVGYDSLLQIGLNTIEEIGA